MPTLKKRIIKNILQTKDVDKALLERIADESENFQQLKENLLRNSIITEEDMLLILSKEYKFPFLDLDKYRIAAANKDILPKEMALRYRVVPLSRIGDVLTLATADPFNVVALDDIKLIGHFQKIDLVLAKEDSICKSINDLYAQGESLSFLKEEEGPEGTVQEVISGEESSLEDIVKESKLPPIVRVVDLMIYEALKKRASDIHIEPTERNLAVRYRVDGVLHHGLSLPRINQSAIMARLKIMSSLNITEFRAPQDGRFKIKFENREIDFRVSSLPTSFGEKIVLRVLDRESLSFGLKNLGFSKIPLRLFEEALKAPFGIILVTGPTGSGKSTTLYSVITQLNVPDKNIVTIEDPVEYQLEGITQIQVKPEIGLTFANSLRSVLRQSPDIIMVGEIRDSETADIAIKASLTGQLIFSTLHTNNSVGAITRLVDMGVEPFLVASSLIASTAQRLVRKLCTKCRQKYTIESGLLEKMGFRTTSLKEFYKPVGCDYCVRTGYRGRIALLEILVIDDAIKEKIVKRATEADITAHASQKREFLSLKDDGLDKCADAVTGLEEVLRVAG
ncbi:MAG: type II/IV secretion system protein [Candidatus Omnitrophota bacterium]|nr:MAG: type II/IV secretion system protein [Candidatus Omnitrophota bacterium]